MSRSDERAIRREVGLITGVWCWRELKDLATELGLDEGVRVVAPATHPPIIWGFRETGELERTGWLMATNERLVVVSRRGPKRRITLPLGSVHGVDAERFFEPPVLAVHTDDGPVEFGIHTSWPKRRAETTLTAFVDHLAHDPSEAAGLAE